ncbi:MAG TPA: hypothetical protein VKZ75_00605 [Cyclobacteriaceae bacterium]|nr:hypothetical protein [Cyclobacteriaceae bacterium]
MATSMLQGITRYLPRLERMLLMLIVLGIVITFLTNAGALIINVAIAGLALVFFLYAYQPLLVNTGKDEKAGMGELLGWSIVPKVLWIGCAISAMGILFFLIKTGTDEYRNMVMIGGFSIVSSLLVLGVLQVSGTKHLQVITPILLRAIPLMIMDFYVFLV